MKTVRLRPFGQNPPSLAMQDGEARSPRGQLQEIITVGQSPASYGGKASRGRRRSCVSAQSAVRLAFVIEMRTIVHASTTCPPSQLHRATDMVLCTICPLRTSIATARFVGLKGTTSPLLLCVRFPAAC